MLNVIQGAGKYSLRLVFNFIFLYAVFICVTPCYGSGNKEKQISTQTVNELIFTGISPRLSNQNEAVQNAVRDAARKLSFYYSVSGHSVRSEYIGRGAFDFHINSDYQLQYDDDLDKYIDMLEYDPVADVYERFNAVFVITRTKASIPMPVFRGDSVSITRPNWIETPPNEINGFAVGIGFSARFSSYRDTVTKSYENAVFAVIEKTGSIMISGELQNYHNSYDTFGFEIINSNETIIYGVLKYFYIIEIWTNPDDLSVWTLAVAAKE